MTSDEIRQMFQANAALKQSFLADPAYPAYLETVQKLTAQYIHDSFSHDRDIEQPKKMKFEEALNVIVKTCEVATNLESEHHPDGISDEQIKELFKLRKDALDCIVKMIMK